MSRTGKFSNLEHTTN